MNSAKASPASWFWSRPILAKLSADSIRLVGRANYKDGLLTININVSYFQWVSDRKWIWYNLNLLLKITHHRAQYLGRIFNYRINAIKIKAATLLFHLLIITNQSHTYKANKLANYFRVLRQTNLVLLSMKFI